MSLAAYHSSQYISDYYLQSKRQGGVARFSISKQVLCMSLPTQRTAMSE